MFFFNRFYFGFLFLFFIQTFCQSNRFIYEYKHIEDTLKKDTLKDLMYLDIDDKKSIFYDYFAYKGDSLLSITNEKSAIFKDKVLKKYYQSVKVSLFTKVYDDIYEVEDNRIFYWNITNDNKNIGDISVQKATTSFAGRNWIAWFTNEIPIPDGPYKFNGLPGLIIKLEDEKKTHSFELVKIEKINNFINDIIPKNSTVVSQERYKKLLNEYKKNPMKNWIQKGVKVSEDSDNISDKDFLRKIEILKKRQISKQNNIIEIYLLKK